MKEAKTSKKRLVGSMAGICVAFILMMGVFFMIRHGTKTENIAETIPESTPSTQTEGQPADSRVLDNIMIRESTYYAIDDITKITFLDTLEKAPKNAWDYSARKDRSVLAWLDGTHLYIGADGGVIAGEDASYMFVKKKNLFAPHEDSFHKIKEIVFHNFDTSRVIDMQYMFANCKSLLHLDLSGFDTAMVTNMAYMLYSCTSLPSLDVSGFDTSRVTNMAGMFWGCTSVDRLDVSGFDTTQVTGMEYMFANCNALKNLDISGFDTAMVTNMKYMFSNCNSISLLDVSRFDTSRVMDMDSMFHWCWSLTNLDVSGFDTSNVTNMKGMFEYCIALTSLNTTGFDMSRVENKEKMFTSTKWEGEDYAS